MKCKRRGQNSLPKHELCETSRISLMHAWESQPLEAMQTWVWRALRMSLDSEEIGHMKEVGGGALVSSLFYSFFCRVCSSQTSFYAMQLH